MDSSLQPSYVFAVLVSKEACRSLSPFALDIVTFACGAWRAGHTKHVQSDKQADELGIRGLHKAREE